MAVVGEAYVVVRAIGDQFKKDVQDSVNGIDTVGERAGRDIGRGYQRGLRRSGGVKLFSPQWFDEAERARVQFRRLTIAQNFLTAAIPGVLGGIGALGGGLLTLVGVLGNAAKGSIVFVSALGGLAQAAVAAKLAFSGVGNAISAGLKAQESSLSNTRALEAAERRLRDARLELKRLIEEEKPERLAEARERAVRAEEAAADALLNSERATRTYNQAQKRTLDALEDLNDAREKAKENLQQLRFELEGGAISEKKARLEFEKARDSLQRVQDLPPNSRARQEAELAFAEAELNLRKAIDNNKDLKKAEQEATRAGVEGSDAVVSAKEAILSAQQAETDAGINAAKAIRDAARAQVEAQEEAAAAAAGGSVERDIDRQIAAAREQVQLAEQAAADAASGGYDAYAAALAKLSPEAQSFTQFIIDQQEAFQGLKDAAGRQLFPQLEGALTIIIGKFDELEPIIEETGAILGRLATDFAETFFQGENFERLKSVFGDNNELLEKLGTAAINLAEGVLILLDNAEPLITAFGDWAVNTSEAWKNTLLLKDGNGQLAEEFDRLKERIERITGIFGNYKDAFGGIFDVINQPGGAGDLLLTYFEEASTAFKNFVETGTADGSLNEFFIAITDNFTKVLDIFKNIGVGLLNLGASPGVGQFLDSINNVVLIFNDLSDELGAEDGPIAKLGEFAEQLAQLFSNVVESGALTVFFDTFVQTLEVINGILGNKIVQSILAALAPLAAFLLAGGAILRSFGFIAKVVGGVVALVRGGLTKAMNFFAGFAIKIIRGFGTKGVAGVFGRILATISRLFGFFIRFLGPIGLIVSTLITVVPLIIKNWDKIKEWFIGLGEKIGEIFTAVFEFFKEKFVEAYEAVAAFFTDVFIPWFQELPGKLAEAAKAVFDWLGEKLSAAWDFIKNYFATVIKFYFVTLPQTIAGWAKGAWDWLSDGARTVWDNVTGFFSSTLFPWFRDLPGKLASLGAGVWDFFKDSFKNVLNFIIDRWNNLEFDLRLPDSIFGIPLGPLAGRGFTLRTPNIPRLAAGGIVQPTRSGTLAVIGEAGRAERVEPLDASGLSKRDRAIIDRLSGGSGTTINVYPSAGMDERDLADLVSKRLAFELRRGAA